MQGKIRWDERPHLYPFEDPNAVSICRLAPGETSLDLEWLDARKEGVYLLEWRPMFTNDPWQTREVRGYEAHIDGLTPWREYEVRVRRTDGGDAPSRYFRAAPVQGTVINYLHPHDDRYMFSGHALCSPSLVKLPSGRLLASMDVYEGRGPQNLSLLFRSDDRGATWHYVCDLYPLFWGNLFVHRGRLYMMGCSTEFGDVVIGASDDEGETWTAPSHLFAGNCTIGDGWEQSPMPIVTYNGRLWAAMEYAGRNVGRMPTFLSAPEDADLLDPASWRAACPMRLPKEVEGVPGSRMDCIIEGNLYVTPEGDLRCMLRVDADEADVFDPKAAVLKVPVEDPDAAPELLGYIPMPAGYNSKFMLRYDAVSGYYFAVGNLPNSRKQPQHRNILALFASPDAVHWETLCRLIDGEREQLFEVGYQYPSFLFDGDDILLQVRTATNGSHNFHDGNYSVFHIIPNFRGLLPLTDKNEKEAGK